MKKNLGYESDNLYSDTHEEYFREFDELLDCLADNEDKEVGEVFSVTIMPVFRIQFWYSPIDYIKEKVEEGTEITINDVIEQIEDLCANYDIELFYDLNEVAKGKEELEQVLKEYYETKDDNSLEEELDKFRKENKEFFYYLYPDTEKTIKGLFVFDNEDESSIRCLNKNEIINFICGA